MAEGTRSDSPKGDTSVQHKVERPPLYRVLLHNDDYTTMEFVIAILKTVFAKQQEEAIEIMLNVHQKGMGVCGIYPAGIAETKIDIVHKRAKSKGYPLRCSMEEE